MRVLVLTLLVLASAGDAQAAQTPVRHGRALAREFCGSCHAVGLRDRSRHAAALWQRIDLDRVPRMLQRVCGRTGRTAGAGRSRALT
jgi:mono/diheme cytochrome c family protein